MGALTSAIQRNDVSGLAHLIVRRLGGDHLDCPIATTTESAPRDIIVELFRDRANADCLERALELVLNREAFNQVQNIQLDPNRTDSVFWLCELFSLIEELRYATLSSSLSRLCLNVAFLDAENPLHRQIQVASLRAYAACEIDRKHLITLFAPGLTNLDIGRDFAYAMAGSAPSEFLSVLAPQLLTRFADLPPTGHNKLAFLSDVIRNAIAAIRSKGQDPIDQGLAIFLQHAADKASHSSGPVIREAVAAALSRTRLPFKELQKFEQSYWDAHPPIDVLKNEAFEAERSALKDLIQTQYSQYFFEPKQPGGVITINPLPYAEAAYFRLFEVVMKVGYGVDVVFQPIKYGRVLASLVEGKITLAAHNPSIYGQQTKLSYENQILQSGALVKFRHYDLLASRTRLMEIVRSQNVSSVARSLASSILDGQQLSPSDPPSETINELVQIGQITFLRNTDTQRVAAQFFGEQEGKYIHSLDPDEGLERLLDGRVCFYVGGALQAHYAKSVCKNRIVVAGELEQGTNLHFFVMNDVFVAQQETFELCLHGWGAVKHLWELLQHPNTAPDRLKQLLELLRTEIVLAINRDPTFRNGFVPSFEELYSLLERHDEFGDLGLAPTYIETTDDEVLTPPLGVVQKSGDIRR